MLNSRLCMKWHEAASSRQNTQCNVKLWLQLSWWIYAFSTVMIGMFSRRYRLRLEDTYPNQVGWASQPLPLRSLVAFGRRSSDAKRMVPALDSHLAIYQHRADITENGAKLSVWMYSREVHVGMRKASGSSELYGFPGVTSVQLWLQQSTSLFHAMRPSAEYIQIAVP